MNKLTGTIGIVLLLLAACAAPASTPTPAPTAAATVAPPTATATSVPPTATPPSPFPLAEPGTYPIGTRTLTFTDASRGGRQVAITVWYPAVLPPGASGLNPSRNADPDLNGAPYPLLLSSTTMARRLAPHLVRHGFAWVSVDGIDSYMQMSTQMIDQPLDILFALDQVAASPPEGLEGVIDAERAGAIGYSFDGYNTLAMSGARIDPAYYRAQCPAPDATTAAILGEFSAFGCRPADAWDEFAAHAGAAITTSEDGLWQPMTDERIRAVMPLAGEGWWLFGERGLAAVDRPTLMIAATEDELYAENALIFEHLGTADKAFISFVGLEHMMIYDDEPVARMAHFATAFFGYHLQGRQDLAYYFSEDFVAQHDDLAWGVVSNDNDQSLIPTVTFSENTCTYTGPNEIERRFSVHWTVDDPGTATYILHVAAIEAGMTIEDIMTMPTDPPPAWLTRLSYEIALNPGDYTLLVDLTVNAAYPGGPIYLVCLSSDQETPLGAFGPLTVTD